VGTFHHGKGDLHGITVVVDTRGPRVWVGRCDSVTAEGVLLLDADAHEEGPGVESKARWLARAAAVGVWGRLGRVLVPAADVASVRRLGEIEPLAPGD
jgi:hypothetical protein